MRLGLVLTSTLLIGGAAAGVARAQCPDGTLPPCAGVRRPTVRAQPPSLAERGRRFLVLPFRNITRGADQEWLVEGSTTMLAEALGRWREISVVSDERLYPALRRAGLAPGAVVELPRVRRVAEETGGWTVVTGEVLATGGRVRVSARAYDVVTSRELVRAAGGVPVGADVRPVFDSIGMTLLRSAGLDTAVVDLSAVTTRSLDAYRAYLLGRAHERRSAVRQAQTAYREAVRADSTFAQAWARLAFASVGVSPTSILDPQADAVRYAARAADLAPRLVPRDRQRILAMNALFRGQLAAARQLLGAVLASDSNDVDALDLLANLEAFDAVLTPTSAGPRPRGSWNAALRLSKHVLELDPSRHDTYSNLVQMYAQAGGRPQGIVVGRQGERGSLAEFVSGPASMVFVPLLRDSITLVPLDSFAFVPRDTVVAARARSREAALAWASRWLAAGPTEGDAHRNASSAYELNGEFPQALEALARAESLGVEGGVELPPVRRMVLLAKAGRIAEAARVSDSLWGARYYDTTNVVVGPKIEFLTWSFTIFILGGRYDRAGALFERMGAEMRRLGYPAVQAEAVAFEGMMGTSMSWLDPLVPALTRERMLDSLVRHAPEVAATPGALGRWLPLWFNRLAAATPDVRAAAGRILDAARLLAGSGHAALGYAVASNATVLDSTLHAPAMALEWYRGRADSLEATRLATLARFHPASATVSDTAAAFEWRVDDAAPFELFRALTPPGRVEYRWDVEWGDSVRVTKALVMLPLRQPGPEPRSVTLSQLVNAGVGRAVLAAARATGSAEPQWVSVPGATVFTAVRPGVLRMVVRDTSVVARLRRERPATARFLFFPCARLAAGERCLDERVPVTYP